MRDAYLLGHPATNLGQETLALRRLGDLARFFLFQLLRNGPFVFHRKGKRLKDFRQTWKRAVEALGKPKLLVHDIRRSFARASILAGIDMKTVMECGGWTTRHTFDRYDIVDEARIQAGLNALSDYADEKRKAQA